MLVPNGARLVAVEKDETVNKTIALQQGNPLRLHYPGDAGGRKTVLQGGGTRQRVENVPHCAQPHDQNTLQHRSLTPPGNDGQSLSDHPVSRDAGHAAVVNGAFAELTRSAIDRLAQQTGVRA